MKSSHLSLLATTALCASLSISVQVYAEDRTISDTRTETQTLSTATDDNGENFADGDTLTITGTIDVEGDNPTDNRGLIVDRNVSVTNSGTIVTGTSAVFDNNGDIEVDQIDGGTAVEITSSIDNGFANNGTTSSFGGKALDIDPTSGSITIGNILDNDDDGNPTVDSGVSIRSTNDLGSISTIRGNAVEAVTIGRAGGNAVSLTGSINNQATLSAQSTDGDATALSIENTTGTEIVNSSTLTARANGFVDRQGTPGTGDDEIIGTGGNATAIRLGDGADINTITNTGNITATSTGVAQDDDDGATGLRDATAIMDESGNLETIDNEGTISAQINDDAGPEAVARAIVLTNTNQKTITNSGAILGRIENTGGGLDITSETTLTTTDSGFLDADNNPIQSTTIRTADIEGDIISTSNGNHTISVIKSDIEGNIELSGNGDNSVSLMGSTETVFGVQENEDGTFSEISEEQDFFVEMDGNILFGAGTNSVTLNNATLNGSIRNADSISIMNSTWAIPESTPSTGNGTITLDNSTLSIVANDTTFALSGTQTTFTNGSLLNIDLNDFYVDNTTIRLIEGNYQLEASTIDTSVTPYIYNVNYSFDPDTFTGTDLTALITRRTGDELVAEDGLNTNIAAQYEASASIFGQNNAVGASVANLDSQEAFEDAYRQLSPDFTGGTTQLSISANDASTTMIQRRMSSLRGLTVNDPIGDGFWGQQSFSFGKQNSDGLQQGYKNDLFILALGYDRTGYSGNTLGFGVMQVFGDTKLEATQSSKTSLTSSQLHVYGGTDFGKLGLDVNAHIGFNKYTSKRRIIFGDVDSSTKGKWSNIQYGVNLVATGEFGSRNFRLLPQAGISYLSVNEGQHTEEIESGTADDGIALSVDKGKYSGLTAFGGLQVQTKIGRNWLAELRGKYLYGLNPIEGITTSYYVDAAGNRLSEDFTQTSGEYKKGSIKAGVGFQYVSEEVTISIDYDADIRSGWLNHTIGITGRLMF